VKKVKGDDGVKDVKRTIHECAGLEEVSNGCHTIATKKIQLEQCICQSDGCNSSHQTTHYDINLLLSIAISLLFALLLI